MNRFDRTCGLVAGILAACLGSVTAHAGAKNNSLSIALSQPIEGVAEIYAPNDEVQAHGRAVFDRLLSIDNERGKILPLLATSWKQVDPQTWDFQLRTDVKFHDGTPFGADDLVYTLNWTSDPKVNFRLKNRYTWIEKAEKLGPSSVRIYTKEPYALTLMSLAVQTPMLPAVVHGKYAKKQDFDWQPVGTGAYKAASVDRTTGIVLVPNENYVQANDSSPKAKIGRITIQAIADEQTRMAQMMVDTVELTRVTSTDIGDAMKADPRFGATTVNGLQYFYFLLDAANRSGVGFLKDDRVRLAIAHAIDREAIRKEIVPGGNAFVLDRLCVPIQIGCASSTKPPAYDPARAKALMREAGHENGFDLEITTLERSRPISEAISGYLSRIGIRATIKTVTLPVYGKLQSEGKFQGQNYIYGSGGIPDTGQLLSFHFNNKPRDYAHDSMLNDLVGRAESILDDGERNKVIAAALDINNRKVYVLPISGAPQAFVHVKDLVIPTTTLNGYGVMLNMLTWK